MTSLFSSPGMTVMTLVILTMQAVSFLFMGALLYEFRHIHEKRVTLLSSLGAATAREVRWRRIFMTVYAVLTFAISFVSSSLFIVQPHFL